jgi:hypothetical protein
MHSLIDTGEWEVPVLRDAGGSEQPFFSDEVSRHSKRSSFMRRKIAHTFRPVPPAEVAPAGLTAQAVFWPENGAEHAVFSGDCRPVCLARTAAVADATSIHPFARGGENEPADGRSGTAFHSVPGAAAPVGRLFGRNKSGRSGDLLYAVGRQLNRNNQGFINQSS